MNDNNDASILIAEDEAITAMHFEMELKLLGCRNFILASDSDSAVRLALERRPRLILMDVNLPGKMDGIEAAREILGCYEAKIVFITGYESEDIRVRAMAAGPAGFYIKPLSPSKIKAILELIGDNTTDF